MATSATLSSHTSLSKRWRCLREAFRPLPISESTSGSCPCLKTFKLCLQIILLSMPTDASIEDEKSLVGCAYHPFDLRARNAHLSAYLDHLNTSSFDPSSDGHWVQPQFMCGGSDSE